MLKNTLFSKAVSVVTFYAFTFAILPHSVSANRGLAPISFNEMYSLAQGGEVEALRASVFRGMNIDTLNSDGDTGLCVAARRHDVYTYNSFRASGANPRHPCTQKISDYDKFVERSKVVGPNGTSREALSAMGDKEDYTMSSKIWWLLGGAAVTGGALWLILGHHHKSKDSSPNSSGIPIDPEESYYSLGANAYSEGGAVIATSGTDENSSVLKYTNTSLKDIDTINLLSNVLNNTNHIKSILYAHDGGNYTNKSGTLLDAGIGTIAMNAVKNSSLDNNGYIRVDSYNASVGMVASEGSQAINHGTGIIANSKDANGINMNFSGYYDNAAAIGMYADTNSKLANYGDIYGTAIKSAQKVQIDGNSLQNNDKANYLSTAESSDYGIIEPIISLSDNENSQNNNTSYNNQSNDENKETKPVQTTSNTGSLVGMEAMILNIGSALKNNTITVINADTGNIYLSAGDSGTTSDKISVQLIGMGSYLDDAFLNKSNVLSRTEKVLLLNEGKINLSYSGNYTASTNMALRKGLGGVVGIRADANTEATNSGSVNIALYDEFTDEGVNVAAGMQSVHGGNITNSGLIEVYTPSANKRINYGMMAVEGSGTNSSLYANLNPQLNNTGDINMSVSNSYGMATFVGGNLTNDGVIEMGSSDETRFNGNIAMYGYGNTQQAKLRNIGTIDLYSYNSIAMQNDYAGGTDITNDGIINIHENAVDSYVFGGAYSNLYNTDTINYYATASKQENTAAKGEIYDPFNNYKISIGTSVMSTKTRSIKEDSVDYKSSTTEAIYNNDYAKINMFGSSFVSAMSVETNDSAESTQAKAYNYGTISIKDRVSKNATNSIGMYIDSGSLNNAGIFNNGEINTDSKFSAAMASSSLKNADIINNGNIIANKESSLGIYISDVSNVLNNGKIFIYGNDSVGIQLGSSNTVEGGDNSYSNAINSEEGIISVGKSGAYVENGFGIYSAAFGTQGSMSTQIENKGIINIYTKNAGAAIYVTSVSPKVENKNIINVFGSDASGIYSLTDANIINDTNGIINVGQHYEGTGEQIDVARSFAIYNIGNSSITNRGKINFYNKDYDYAIYSIGNTIIKNEGTINLANEKGTAIYSEGGKVTNLSTINLSNDYNTAVELNGNAEMINDSDGIINVGSSSHAVSNSVGIKSGNTSTSTITNKGIINLYASQQNNSYAIAADGNASIINAKTGFIHSYNDNSTAVSATGVVSFTNNGKINILGNNSTAIKGTGENSVLSVENNNSIAVGQGTDTTGSSAIYAQKADSIINNGNIDIYSTSGCGIYATEGQNNNRIINNSNVNLHKAQSTGIYGGAIGNIANNGTITADGQNSKGIEVYTSDTGISQTVNNNKNIIINNGNNSYGIYSEATVTINNNKESSIRLGSNSSTFANGYGIYAPNAIKITNAGDIDVYASSGAGIVGGTSIVNSKNISTHATNNYGIYSANSANVENSGVISVSDGWGISSSGNVINKSEGLISVANGIGVQNAESLDNSGKIEVNSSSAAIYNVKAITISNEDAYIKNTHSNGKAILNAQSVINYGKIESSLDAIYNDTAGSLKVENYGIISVTGSGDANAIHNVGSIDVFNEGTIQMGVSTRGNAINAIVSSPASKANIINEGNIIVDGIGNGIYVQIPTNETDVTVVNNGYIEVVSGYGILIDKLYGFTATTDEQGNVTYNPSSEKFSLTNSSATVHINCTTNICSLPSAVSTASIDDPAEPVYADSPSSSLIAATDASSLRGVHLVNRGIIATSGNVNFGSQNADNAQISIGNGGSYQADSFTGTISADTSIVEGGFETTYINNDSFVGENNGIEVISQSYMFDAKTIENNKGNTDIVMTMKPFNEIVDNDNLSAYLSHSYEQQSSEHVFNILKSAADKTNFTKYLNKELGIQMIPNLIKQSINTERNISSEINEDLLDLKDKETRTITGMTAYKNSVRSKNNTSGYKDSVIGVYGFYDTAIKDRLRSGFGLSVVRANSSYDDDSSRYNNTVTAFVPIIADTEWLTAMIKPKIGISRGHYRRAGVDDIYKAKTKEYFYGADAEAKKRINAKIASIEPMIGINITSLHTDEINETNDGLKIKDENTLSATSIIGIDINRQFNINDKSNIILGTGIKYYHEFGDKYENNIQLAETNGYFNLLSNRFQRDYGLLKFKVGYDYEQISADASVFVPLQNKHRPYYMFNAKYKF